MFLPIRTDSPLRHTPYMNWALIALNLLVFLVTELGDMALAKARFELWPNSPRLYQFITYAFLHHDWWHIGGNMLFLYIFGSNVNDKMGNVGYLAFYLGGAVFAGIMYVTVPSHGAPVLGASGAIMAVTGAYLILFPYSNVTVLYFFFLIGTYELASLWFILIYFAFDVFATLRTSGPGDGVAHIAHLGGTLFGCGICFGLLMLRLLPRDQFDVVALLQRWNKRRQYRDLVTRGYNPFDYAKGGGGSRSVPAPPDPRTQQILELRSRAADAASKHDLSTAADLYLQLKQADPQQVLPRQTQLDVANQLAGQQRYPQAAEAYEQFLRHYPKYEQLENVELMLGLIYARYLNQVTRARQCLENALARLHGDRERALATEELARLGPAAPASPPHVG